MIELDKYEDMVDNTAIYPKGDLPIYPALGLFGESGEVAEKIKKIIRDKEGNISEEDRKLLLKELGDIVWYVTAISHELKSTLHEVMQINFTKLTDRAIRNKLQGEGDER